MIPSLRSIEAATLAKVVLSISLPRASETAREMATISAVLDAIPFPLSRLERRVKVTCSGSAPDHWRIRSQA